ncbi:F-box domain containing protein [Pandoravirus macleodensis]|uniref:F-box domain containing protein n=1 Tax=Pandoravirus macleodensis TaxID=2107707 RepID=A0A2U7UEQ3_9VIRU|nr:F-box domain containing protein [Pandoravirus macleodensis]AVK76951.1 F-box domain containing protein [Pandoravirus macleodensis]
MEWPRLCVQPRKRRAHWRHRNRDPRSKRRRSTLLTSRHTEQKDTAPARDFACRALLDLPDEILVRIVTAVETLPDMAALATTCRKMASLWRDDVTWRDLFARDYGHFYKTGVVSMTWHPKVHPHAPWPDDAKRFWREMMEAYEPGTCLDDMEFGPDTPCDARVPAPFAHMAALGKNWKWLYASHCPISPGRQQRPLCTSGTLDMGATKHMPAGAVSATYRGDVSSVGLPDGYGISLYEDASGSVTHFLQSMWRNGQPEGWQTLVSAVCASSSTVHGRVARISYVVKRDGLRVWGKRKGTSMHGMMLAHCVDGSHMRGVFKEGRFFCGTAFYSDGASTGDWAGALASREDRLDRLPNGDTFLYERDNEKPVGVRWFRCSSRSPHADYAGRTIRNVSWRLIHFESDDDSNCPSPVYVPARDCDTDDARAFWRYVRLERGGIGWDERMRRIALEACPTGDMDVAPL